MRIFALIVAVALLAQRAVTWAPEFGDAAREMLYGNESIITLDFVDGTLTHHGQKMYGLSRSVNSVYRSYWRHDAIHDHHYLRQNHFEFRSLIHWSSIREELDTIADSGQVLGIIRNIEPLQRPDCYLSADHVKVLVETLPQLRLSASTGKFQKAAKQAFTIETAQLKECAWLAENLPTWFSASHDFRPRLVDAIEHLGPLLALEKQAHQNAFATILGLMPKGTTPATVARLKAQYDVEHAPQLRALKFLDKVLHDFAEALEPLPTLDELSGPSQLSMMTHLHVAALGVAAQRMRKKAEQLPEISQRHLYRLEPALLAQHVEAVIERETGRKGNHDASSDNLMRSFLQIANDTIAASQAIEASKSSAAHATITSAPSISTTYLLATDSRVCTYTCNLNLGQNGRPETEIMSCNSYTHDANHPSTVLNLLLPPEQWEKRNGPGGYCD